jgi:hypothetical protein
MQLFSLQTVFARSCPHTVELNDPAPSTPWGQLIANASHLFGWQLASILPSSQTTGGGACADFCQSPGVLPQIGVQADITCAVLCAVEGCDATMDGDNAVQQVANDLGQIFFLDLAYSLNATESTFGFLCDQLDPRCLSAFLDSDGAESVINSVCSLAGNKPFPSSPHSGNGTVPSDVLADFSNSFSSEFALGLYGSSYNLTEINEICDNFQRYFTNIELMRLNPVAVNQTFCNEQAKKVLYGVGDLTERIASFSTHLAAILVFSASGSQEYKNFICKRDTSGHFTSFSESSMAEIRLIPKTFFSYLEAQCKPSHFLSRSSS